MRAVLLAFVATVAVACGHPLEPVRAPGGARFALVVDVSPREMRLDGEVIESDQALLEEAYDASEDRSLDALVIAHPDVAEARVTEVATLLSRGGFLNVTSVTVPGLRSSNGSAGAGTPQAQLASLPLPVGPQIAPNHFEWKCVTPRESLHRFRGAETAVLRVLVGADGAPRGVELVEDPGAGYGRVAAACAMLRRYTAARDGAGNTVEAMTSPIRVHMGW